MTRIAPTELLQAPGGYVMVGGVVSFGTESLAGVREAFRRVLSRDTVSLFLLPREDEETMEFEPYRGSLDSALDLLGRGAAGAVQFQGSSSEILGGVYRPNFGGRVEAWWEAWVEGPALEASSLFGELQAIDDLSWIALSIDDSPDVEGEVVTSANFPWDFFLLVCGAVRDQDGEWVVRRDVPLSHLLGES